MLFELSEIQKQQALVENLQESRQNLQNKLIRSYSANQKNQTSLKQKFNALLQQSTLLIQIMKQIEQGIQHKSLFPTILSQKDITKLLYSTVTLPDWFDYVFLKEYEKEKINIETIASKMYKLHGLGEKNLQLINSYRNLQILLGRYESLSRKELENLDIREQVQNFQFLYKSCKEMYRNFLDMMAKKVLGFLESTVQSTMLYSNQLKKVKSLDEHGLQKFFTLNQKFENIQSPRSNYNENPNVDSRNTIKMKSVYEGARMGDYYLSPQNKSNRYFNDVIKNHPTVESLRQRQKANNDHFFRQSQQSKNNLNDNSITRQIIKSARSHDRNIYKGYVYHAPSQDYIKPREESKNSSIRSAKSYYDESIVVKKYKSSSNFMTLAQDIPATRKYPPQDDLNHHSKVQQNYSIRKPAIRQNTSTRSRRCLHHCPHHDKPLNNHCSKHCNQLCSHEKNFFNNFGLDLPAMNRQYYQGLKSPKENSTSRSRGNVNLSTKTERNIAESKPYLRNSHDKHSDYYQLRMSPVQKENVGFYGNRQSNQVQNFQHLFHQRTERSSNKKAFNHPDRSQNRLRSPPVRDSEYYYS